MTSSHCIFHPSVNFTQLYSIRLVQLHQHQLQRSSTVHRETQTKAQQLVPFAIDVDDYWNLTSTTTTTTSCTASTVFIIIEVHGCGSHDSWAREVNKILDSKVTIIMLRLLSLYHFVTLLLWSIYVTPTLVLLSLVCSLWTSEPEWLKCNLMMMCRMMRMDFNDFKPTLIYLIFL